MIWEFLCCKMAEHPDATVTEGDRKFTYKELMRAAEVFGSRLHGEKCCAVYCESELNSAIAVLACFVAGVTAVPLSHKYGRIHCMKILKYITPTCIVTDDEGELKIKRQAESAYVCPDNAPALIMCTSGTSGTPKGVMLSEKNILTNVSDISLYFELDITDTILIARPLYHCAVLTGEFLTSLIKGVSIVFSSGVFNPLNIIKLLRERNITVFCGTPTLLSALARFTKKDNGFSLKTLAVSGECMSAETGVNIAKGFPLAKIYHVYGLTEACPRVSFMPPDRFLDAPDRVGIPLRSVEIKILDENGELVKRGARGVLWVRGDNIMQGYYNAPDLTKKVLCDGWLCTCDIASVDDNGWLKIHGRSDDMIIRAGMNIYPQEIEAELKKDPRTKEVLVYKIDDPKLGIFIGMDISGDYDSIESVHNMCMEVLPAFQVPSVINVVEEIKKNGSGKIVRARNNVRI